MKLCVHDVQKDEGYDKNNSKAWHKHSLFSKLFKICKQHKRLKTKCKIRLFCVLYYPPFQFQHLARIMSASHLSANG